MRKFTKLAVLTAMMLLMGSMLNAQSRFVQHGRVMWGNTPVGGAEIVLEISPNNSPYFTTTLPEYTTTADSNGYWFLRIDLTLFPHSGYDDIRATATYNNPCPHQSSVTGSVTVPYTVVNEMNIQLMPNPYVCTWCTNIDKPRIDG